ILRMDQPYSRIPDMLLDYQYWSPNDPQKAIYDDTGWTFGELGNVQVVRVADVKVLDAPMEMVKGDVRSPGGIKGGSEGTNGGNGNGNGNGHSGAVFVINHNAD